MSERPCGGGGGVQSAQALALRAKIVLACAEGATNEDVAGAVGLNQTAVSRIWCAFGLKPHQVDGFKLSTDPQFVEKVRDIVGLYLAPPEHAMVLAVDEKSQIQALDRSAPMLPVLPAAPGRQTHDYLRHSQDPRGAALAAASPPLPPALHPVQRLVVELDRAARGRVRTAVRSKEVRLMSKR